MCGFAGFVNLDGRTASYELLRRMVEVQHHRGPDDQGFRLFSLNRSASAEVNGKFPRESTFEAALGFNRLSILDLSHNGHQPMGNEDESVFIAFNGEIYNAFDYVPELKDAGYQFRSRTDTEVILRLYERYGLEGMVERLNGMFAIVIVDLRKRELHLVRDHLGIKPLYWSVQGRTLFFSSEVKSLLAHPEFRVTLNPDHLSEYLLFRYCAAERHLLKDVRQLQAGHVLRLKDGDISVRRFWEIPDRKENGSVGGAEAQARTEELIHAGVKSQLLSDVKVGCQLSGGIDSSLITLSAREQCDADMDAFSITFRDGSYSEDRWISQAAAIANVHSHRFLFDEGTLQDSFTRATWHMDQPLSHPNALGIYHLARRSRALATVMLSGEGADELFGGYTRFFYASIRPAVKGLLPLLCRLPVAGAKFGRVLGRRDDDLESFFILASSFQNPAQAREFYPGADVETALEQRRAVFREGAGDHLGNCMKYDMQTYMAELLVRQDKMTMAHSMENRVPYLDRRLVEYVRTLPASLLVGNGLVSPRGRMGSTKMLLKQVAVKAFGGRFVYRMKSGFAFPLGEFFRSPWFRNYTEEVLFPAMRRRGLWNTARLYQWWKEILAGQDSRLEAFWTYLAFEAWAIHVLDRQSAESAWKTTRLDRPLECAA